MRIGSNTFPLGLPDAHTMRVTPHPECGRDPEDTDGSVDFVNIDSGAERIIGPGFLHTKTHTHVWLRGAVDTKNSDRPVKQGSESKNGVQDLGLLENDLV